MILVVEQTDTLAKCEEFQKENKNAMLEALPGMSELVDEAAKEKEKEQAAVKKPAPKRQKDYDFKAIRQCTIL
ncbi:hypothetical protein GGH94_004606 [Coemansia aciculifera]|uniref:Uncharacterized protein n=1 Tax=Coemansia aciculifera TaxID=417176 RepID=A0A9W8M216_9FUNG|nr:hypothetical protein GGH94_004606 [Coemansia aciculifera]KAJ2871807.1 hypothetical protein GGH93_004533 [Coemansia aciculifera]